MAEVSVIMPVYNCEQYLAESIESVLNQTFEDFEFICVDDGSVDSSPEILERYAGKDSRMRVFHQKNMGGGAARNAALEKACGKYLLFIDSDDVLYSDAVEKSYDLIKRKNADFILFKAISYDSGTGRHYEEDYFTMPRIHDRVGDEVFSYEEIGNLVFEMSATPWGKLYDMDFIRRSGARFAEGIIFHDNLFFWDMLFSCERICFLDETLYVHRKHSKSIQGSRDRRFLNIFPAVEGIVSVFVKHGNLDRYRDFLFNWKVNLLSVRYAQIQDAYSGLFFDEFKRDLSAMAQSEGYGELMKILNPENRRIFKSVMNAQTCREYDLLIENDNLRSEVCALQTGQRKLSEELDKVKKTSRKLKKENAKLKKSNEKIKRDYSKTDELNRQILNSKSWKVTEPLRKIRRL